MGFIILIIFLSLFVLINFYIGLKGWKTFSRIIPWMSAYVYWTLFFVLVFSFIIGRAGKKFLPLYMDNVFDIIGSYWIAALMYFIIIIVLAKFVKLLNRWLKFLPENFYEENNIFIIINLSVIAVVSVILIYGSYNARHPVVNHYQINVDKRAGDIKKLRVAMVSDLHLGYIVNKAYLDKMVSTINSTHPDIVFLVGDLIDDDPGPFEKLNMGESLLKLKSTYGTYAVLGNHEYIGGKPDEAEACYEAAGIKVLRDNSVKIGDSFYVIGRDDASGGRRQNKNGRESLEELMNGEDKNLPFIVLDHQPVHLEEGEKCGADVQFSGHTHGGQFYPNKIFTDLTYEKSWGYLKKGNFNVIVSCGYGTWGPPIRIGTVSEIVEADINFKK